MDSWQNDDSDSEVVEIIPIEEYDSYKVSKFCLTNSSSSHCSIIMKSYELQQVLIRSSSNHTLYANFAVKAQ